MELLRVSLIQTYLHWESPAKNRVHFENLMEPLAGTTDLIVLPEMFTTVFSMLTEKLAETMAGATINLLKQKASNIGCAITGSIITDKNHSSCRMCVMVF